MLKLWPFQSPDGVVVAGPAAVGVKLYTIWQLSPGLSVLPWQPWKPEKGEPTPPPAPDITTALGPMLVTVTASGGDVVPTCIGPKSSAVGVMRNSGPSPRPLSAMLKAWPFQCPL